MSDVPDTIGPYEVVRPIAQGGMAEVFEVRDPPTGEHHAVKLLVALDTAIKRFNREFEAMTRLNHPNIVRVYRYGHADGKPWMSMEMLRGEPLQVHVKDFGPPGTARRTDEVIRVAFHVASALQYVHDRGLVHRDLKSANVQVLRDGRVKLLDFGTAHLVDPLERITQEGDFVGTFSYAAPEQIVGGVIDHRTDLYALGILLYRLLTGRRPFHASDPHKVAHMHLHTVAQAPRKLVPEIPVALEKLVMRLLEKKPADRPAQAEQVAAELEQIAGRSLAVAGLGLALYDDQALGRSTHVRDIWTALEANTALTLVARGEAEERGKLLDALLRDASKRGWNAVPAHRVEGLEGLAGAVSYALPNDDARELGELLADHVSPTFRTHTLRALSERLVAALGGPESQVLWLIDGDLMSDEGLAWVDARVADLRAAGGQVAVVAALREADVGALSALRSRLGLPHVVDLRPLDARGVAVAVGQLLNRRPPPPDVARQLQVATGGRPSLLEDVLRRMIDEGRISVRDDDPERVNWEAADLGLEALPPETRAALEERFGELPAPSRRVLEALHVLGGEAAVGDLAHGLGLRVASLAVVLRSLVHEGLVAWGGLPRDLVRPVDPLVVRWLGEAMPPWRRSMLQHLVAGLLEAQPASPAQVRLLVAVGRGHLAVERALGVARARLDRGGVGEAIELLELVHPYADHPALPVDARVAFHLAFAEAVQRSRPMDARAARALEAAAKLAVGTAREAEVRLALAEQQRSIGHYQNHRKFLLEAWDLVSEGAAQGIRARVALDIARSFLSIAQVTQARGWFDAALEAAMSDDDRDTADLARIGLAEIQLALGDAAQVVDVLDRLVQARGDQGDPSVRAFAVAMWAQAMRRTGAFTRALPRVLEAVAEARDGQSVPAWAAVTLAAALLELDLCRLGRAQELVDELASALTPGERLDVRLETRLIQGRLELASGQLVQAAFRLEETVDQADKAGLTLIVELGRAWLAEARAGLGGVREAKALYQQALLGLMATGNLMALADAVVSRSRALGALEDPTKAFKLVGKLLAKRLLQPLNIEHLLGEMRWAGASGDQLTLVQSAREARAAINRLASGQGDIEQAALRVHPWAHEILHVDIGEVPSA